MDIGVYISELLAEHGEISVPGLGYLVQAYIPGHYSDADSKFYPPHHVVQFDPQQLDDDDTLTEYIAGVKNISVSSSKYFTEKFTTEIRENALVKEIPIGELGWFYTEHGRLLFRAANKVTNDPAFFGYVPVNIRRIGQGPIATPEPIYNQVITPTPASPPIDDFNSATEPVVIDAIKPAEVTAAEQSRKQALIDEFNARNKASFAESSIFAKHAPTAEPLEERDEEEEGTRKRPLVLIIIVSVLLLAALAFVGVYKFAPTRFERAKEWVKKITGRKGDAGTSSAPVDTAKPKPKEAVAVIPKKIDTTKTDSLNNAPGDTTGKAVQSNTLNISTKPVIKPADAPADKTGKTNNIETKPVIKPADVPGKTTKTAAVETKTVTKPAETPAKTVAKPNVIENKPVTQPASIPANQVVADVPGKKKKKKGADVQQETVLPATMPVVSSAPIGTGSTTPITIDPKKQWAVIAYANGFSSDAEVSAAISNLKKKGIDGFVVPSVPGGKMRVAVQMYATNAEAAAGVVVYKKKGLSEAYLNQIIPRK